MKTLLVLLLALAALPARAQAPGADAAAADLLPYLEAPAVLAATAALLHAETGRYPGEPFALLGAPVAEGTGARQVRLAQLALSADGDTLRADYVLTPSPEVPDERTGSFALFREGDGYTARVRLDLRADPDQRDADLPLTERGALAVHRAYGRLCLDTARVRALAAEGRLAEAAPFLSGEAIELTFVPVGGGAPVATATLAPPGAGP
jgi:hypothetical protein